MENALHIALVASAFFLANGVPAQPTPPPCTAPEYRQFDFWIGDWNVYDPKGVLEGTNDVTREYDGCVVQEHWVATGPPPQRGSSFNTWSPASQRWHQTWVDSTGGLLVLEGGLRDGVMTLAGDTRDRGGVAVRNRIAWSILDDGRVRQFWERTRDGGKTWTVVFEGTYVKKK
jgi:hypothetical protein